MKQFLLMACLLLVVSTAQANPVSLTPRQYEQLNQLSEAINGDDPQKSRELGQRLYAEPGGTAEQQAFIRAFAARVLAQLDQEKPEQAAGYLERALQDRELLDQDSQKALHWQLMQVYVAIPEYLKGLQQLEAWWPLEENHPAEALYLRAALLSQLERWSQAEPWILQALQVRQPDSWLALAVAISQRQEKWQQAAGLQQQRVQLQPENSLLWRQLAQLQQLAGLEREVLITLELAQRGGHLNEAEQRQLGQRFLVSQQPLRAAQVFEQLIDTLDETDLALLRLTAQAWLQTSNRQQETHAALERLARHTAAKEDWRRLGDWHFSQGRWQPAIAAWQQIGERSVTAQEKAHLELLMANAYIEMQDYPKARRLLEELLATSEERAARQWLNYLRALDV